MKYIKKCIKILLRKAIWLLYYFFYSLPIDCYFYVKSFLGLLKENEYLGSSDFGDKICIFVSYPKDGRISESLNRYLLDLQLLGYSIIFITNKHVVLEDIEKIKSICVRIIIRENYGKDFGAYKHGILKYKNQILNSKSLLIANDSVIHIKSLKPMFDVMNAKNLDFWGVSEAYGPAVYQHHHICSYFLVINQKILKSEIFWNFWQKKYKPTYSRVQVIKNGEIAFSSTIKKHSFDMDAYINSHKMYQELINKPDKIQKFTNTSFFNSFKNNEQDIYSALNLMYRLNHNVIYLKLLLQLELPLLKKDVFSRCKYYAAELLDILNKLNINNAEDIIEELLLQVNPKKSFKDKILEFIGEK